MDGWRHRVASLTSLLHYDLYSLDVNPTLTHYNIMWFKQHRHTDETCLSDHLGHVSLWTAFSFLSERNTGERDKRQGGAMCPLLLLQTFIADVFQKHFYTLSHLRNQYSKCGPPLKLQTHHLHTPTDKVAELIRSRNTLLQCQSKPKIMEWLCYNKSMSET